MEIKNKKEVPGLFRTIGAELFRTLLAALPEQRNRPQLCRPLILRLKGARRRLRHHYRSNLGYNRLSSSDRWIMDNYPRLDREISVLIRSFRDIFLPSPGKGFLPDLFPFLQLAVKNSAFSFTTDSVLELVSLFGRSRPLDNAEEDFLIPLIKAAAVTVVSEALHPCDGGVDADALEEGMKAFFAAGTIDGERINEETNPLERLLSKDPPGVYSLQDVRTRALYRYKMARAARISGMNELVLAQNLLQEARRRGDVHIGFPLWEYYESVQPENRVKPYYFRLLFFLPAAASFLLSGVLGNPLWIIPLYLPCYELFRPMLERLALKGSEVAYAPRLSLEKGIPPEGQSLITLSTLLPAAGHFTGLRERLVDLLLQCPKQNAGVCLLADLSPAKEAFLPEDRAALKELKQIAKELNQEYDNRIVCLVRNRRYSKTGREYSGWERKRGAITALSELIQGKPQDLAEFCGNTDLIYGTKYLLTLDYDTGMTIDCLKELISIALHPMNRPCVGPGHERVSKGYGILVPRIVPDLADSMRSLFSRILCGVGGISTYDASCAELYQDVWGEGIFSGKGLIDVEAYCSLLPKKFEEETVLSHDILEGGLLRALFVGDVELTDGFPRDGMGYFKRLHRWVRGDFQNVPFLLRKVRLYQGIFPNPLNRLSRFKLLDNLRRTLTPVLGLLCVVLSAALPNQTGWLLLLAGLLSAAFPYLYSIWRMVLTGAVSPLARRFYSGCFPKSVELLARAVTVAALLPQTAWTALDGGIRGLYRRLRSHQKLLEWTTAAQADASNGGFCRKLLFYLPQFVAGGFLLWFGRLPWKLVGTFFLLAVPFLVLAARPAKKKAGLSKEGRDLLLADLGRMLRFYEDYATGEEHYLPPDNVQFAPAYAVARRTSPTNIGMMLLTYLTARDCGLISTRRLFEAVSRTVGTLEQMKTFHGNLYNWYDTGSLAILPPGFVSTVDSGNLACCLVALREGLLEYLDEEGGIPALPERIQGLIDQVDLTVFYDTRRNLFSIGWDSEAGEQSPSHYDMLMSEARMMSYFAIATGQAPARHWPALSRNLSQTGLHAGPVAWTGTMFEFFMPELLLRCVRGSIGYEALEYCIRCQKRRVRREDNVPWGISESGIYAFDAALNYQYCPNGVQQIALKQGMDDTLVIAPYASYLALSRDPAAVLSNLEQLKKLGGYGQYGFYEAVDFTKKRVGESRYRIVQSVMAHHIGMSAVAIGNLLNDGIMQRRFLRDRDMRRAASLLSEKIAVGEFVFESLFAKKKKTVRKEVDEYEYVGHLFPQQPRVKLLSNSEMTSVLTDVGASYLRCNRTDIFRRPNDLLRAPVGLFGFVRLAGDTIPLSYAPSYRADISYETAFSGSGVLYTAQNTRLSAKTEVRLHHGLPVEERVYTLQNRADEDTEMVLLIYAEPSLFPREDDDAHRSFSKLFLETEWDKEKRAAIVTRRKRGNEEGYVLAMGFLEEEEADVLFSREDIFERPDIQNPRPSAFSLPREEFSPSLPDPCVAFRIRLKLKKGDVRQLTLLTSVGRSQSDAVAGLAAIRSDGGVPPEEAARPRLSRGTLASRAAQTLLPQVLFRKRDSNNNLTAVSKNELPPSSLWRLGISADFPIVLCEVHSAKDTERVEAYASCHSALRLSFVEFDLVFLYDGAFETGRVIRESVLRHCGDDILNRRAGIHILPLPELSAKERTLLFAAACHIATRSMVRIEAPARPYLPISIRPVRPGRVSAVPDVEVPGGFFAGDSFFVTQPPRSPWCHVLANPTFGTLLSDRALGFTWAVNSRENKLTPWYNDPLRDNPGEMLLLKINGFCYNLTSGAAVEFNPRYARYYGVASGISSRVTVSVPAKGMMKYLEVELNNLSDSECEAELCYYTEPCLGVTREHARQIQGRWVNNTLLLHNPFNGAIRAWMGLSADGAEAGYACDRPAFFSGIWDQNQLLPMQDPCAALTVKRKLKPETTASVRFLMSFSTTEKGALALLRLKPSEEYQTENAIHLTSGDPAVDVLVNTWLPWQTAGIRMFARTGFYQNGGAYGFRDQLQDACGYLLLSPRAARLQIYRCCAVQFEEGDVLHWWHTLPESGAGKRGVRTRYSDDLVWLPYAVCRYVEVTGDESILDTKIPYLSAPELEEGQKDNYLRAAYSELKETVFAHCVRAIARAWNLGEHGLPKIGGGDWNDGYNKVGVKGKGESVWLAQFLSLTEKSFAKLCRRRGETDAAIHYEREADALLTAVDKEGWDGEWYLRAFYDSGREMGSKNSDECQIDSLPQSFSVLAGMPDKQRRDSAMKAAYQFLVDEEYGIVRLFSPSFDKSLQEPGYVKAYPPGIRENGGQYTHAAVWLAMAACENGMKEMFFQLTDILNPIKRLENPKAAEAYRLEPFWMAADISTNSAIYGRGGWSMYTGAAGWYYRLLVEYMLGVRFTEGFITWKPCLPPSIKDASVEIRQSERTVKFFLRDGQRVNNPSENRPKTS